MAFTIRASADAAAQFEQDMAEEYLRGEKAVSLAMAGAQADLKAAWRGQIRGAGLGSRLANAVRGEAYPKGQPSMNAAALVWSNAPKITAAHEAGPLITSRNGFWLAIPTAAAGKGRRGRITPGEWESRTGRRLRFIYRRGRTALLVDTGQVLSGARTVGRDGFSRKARGFKNRSVVIFTLVPQVKLRKRLDLMGAADQVGAGLPARIVANWRD